MKKYCLLLVVIVGLVACNLNGQKTISEILKKPVVNEEVTTSGGVCHVCHCTARRCLLVNDNMQCLLVEWKDKTKKFKRSILNKKIKVSGILKSKVLSEKRVIEMLEHAKEHDSKVKINESKRILQWMKVNDKKSYTSYYIECLDYEELK